jgi:hypothetical protein
MNTMTVILILAVALSLAMIFQAIVFFFFMREFKNVLKDILNRYMAKNFTEYVRGETALHPRKETEPERREEEAIPI